MRVSRDMPHLTYSSSCRSASFARTRRHARPERTVPALPPTLSRSELRQIVAELLG